LWDATPPSCGVIEDVDNRRTSALLKSYGSEESSL
jgi:hypothetical protein